MKKSIIIILILIFASFLCFTQNYKRALVPKGMYTFDLRYINQLEKEKNYDKINLLFNKLINDESSYEERNQIMKYVYEERKYLRDIKYSWLYNDPNKLYEILKQLIENKKDTINYLPPSITVGRYESDANGIVSNLQLSDYLKNNKSNLIKISQLYKINENYVFKVYGLDISDSPNLPIVFSIIKINNSIYNKLNNKFELANIDSTSRDLQDNELHPRLGFEKIIVYGIISNNKNYIINEKYFSSVDKLNLRNIPSIKNS